MITKPALPWYALKIRPKWEGAADAALRNKSYATFLPSYQEYRRYSDRKKAVWVPMFPGYLFCRLDPEDRLPVLKSSGVEYLLGHSTPEAIPEDEIAAIRRVINSSLMARPWPFLNIGQRVVVQDGPLAGVQGLLVAEKGADRLVLSVEMLKRAISVQVERSWIRPLSK